MNSWNNRILGALALCLLAGGSCAEAGGGGNYFTISYPHSGEPGRLAVDADYTLWLPEGVTQVRAVIVHQHGCGSDANAAGETAAHDLHWQALAAKWNAGLLAPRYHQTAQGREGCEVWDDPRHGSYATFLQALDDLAVRCGHAELKSAPWCLWGHSGGAYWVSLVQTLAPERIVAAWLRSGTAFPAWEGGDIAKPELPDAVFRIPTMLNPGIKESTDGRAIAAWLGSAAMFKAYRQRNAPIAFAADPLSGHDCGDSRYLAIPYFDACLELRLPESGPSLRTLDLKQGWLAELMGRTALPAVHFNPGKAKTAVWLPNERIARAWMEYVTTGATSDTTPPPAPTRVTVTELPDHSVEIAWDAAADFESGLRGFLIERDGQALARVPEQPLGKFGRPLFQTLSFHDTPEPPLPVMRFVDTTAARGTKHEYRVIAINGVGLQSPAAGRSADRSN
jgi:hypothetical protein